MKRIGKRFCYTSFFCAIAITLFSLESTMQLEENGLIIEETQKPTLKRGIYNDDLRQNPQGESSSHSPEDFIPTPTQETKTITPSHIEEKKEEETSPVATSPSTEKLSTENAIQKDTKEKTDEPKEAEETEFSSIQSSGLTLANGDNWYFEEYDQNGNIISVASYNKKKLLSKSQFEYNENGKKIGATFTEQKRIVKLTFNDKGVEIGRSEYKKRKGEAGDIYLSEQKSYDETGRLQEETITENGITTRRLYTYDGKKLATETVFENDMKTLFIEYQEKIRIVHIFDDEVELSVFEEALE